MYAAFLVDWLAHFPGRQLLALPLEGLDESPKEWLSGIYSFLDLRAPTQAEWGQLILPPRDEIKKKTAPLLRCSGSPDVHFGPMQADTRAALELFFGPWNAALRRLLVRKRVNTVPGYGVQFGGESDEDDQDAGADAAWWWTYPKAERKTHRSGTDAPWPPEPTPPQPQVPPTEEEEEVEQPAGDAPEGETDAASIGDGVSARPFVREASAEEESTTSASVEQEAPSALSIAPLETLDEPLLDVSHSEMGASPSAFSVRRCTSVACWNEMNPVLSGDDDEEGSRGGEISSISSTSEVRKEKKVKPSGKRRRKSGGSGRSKKKVPLSSGGPRRRRKEAT